MTIFAVNVRARRLSLGLSVSELARRAGISQSGLWRIEAGEREPSLSAAVALAVALAASLDELAEVKSYRGEAKRNTHKHKHIGT